MCRHHLVLLTLPEETGACSIVTLAPIAVNSKVVSDTGILCLLPALKLWQVTLLAYKCKYNLRPFRLDTPVQGKASPCGKYFFRNQKCFTALSERERNFDRHGRSKN